MVFSFFVPQLGILDILGKIKINHNFRYTETNFDFNRYHTLDEYENYLESVAQAFPDLAQLKVIGFTHEKRRLLCLKVLVS